MNLNAHEFQTAFQRDVNLGRFVTPKHDPASASQTSSRDRSVFTPEFVAGLSTFSSSAYTVVVLSNPSVGLRSIIDLGPNGAPIGYAIPAGSMVATATQRAMAIVFDTSLGHLKGFPCDPPQFMNQAWTRVTTFVFPA